MFSVFENCPKSLTAIDDTAERLLDARRVSSGRSASHFGVSPAWFTSRLIDNEELWLAPTRLHLSLLRSSPFGSIQNMTLSCLFLPSFTFETFHWCFEGFLQQLRGLELDRPISCPQTLVAFIASFPNLQETAIWSPTWLRETSTMRRDRSLRLFGEHTPKLRGALYLSGLAQDSGRFLSYLATGVAHFEKVALGDCTFGDPRPLQSFISSIGHSLKKFHVMLGGVHSDDFPDIALGECRELQQIMFSFHGPEAPFPAMAAMLSTVTSTVFSSFILDINARCPMQVYSGNLRDQQMEGIRMFDLPLSRLAVRRALRNTHKRVFIMILADDPEPLALGLVRFHRVGNIWAGEKIEGGVSYSWSFSEAEEVDD